MLVYNVTLNNFVCSESNALAVHLIILGQVVLTPAHHFLVHCGTLEGKQEKNILPASFQVKCWGECEGYVYILSCVNEK